MNPFDAAAVLIVLAAILGYVNCRFIGLPHTIGLTIIDALASLAVVMGGYALARRPHVSGPLAMAEAGLFIGNRAIRHAMSAHTRQTMTQF